MKPDDVKKELDHYIRIKCPNYAVEITGGWGTGKTFFIRNYIKNQSWFGLKRPIYISLYGIEKLSEIENQIWIKALFCILLKTIITVVSFASILVLLFFSLKGLFYSHEDKLFQFFGIAGTSLLCFLAWFYRTFKESIFNLLLFGNIIVFDDFERAEMSSDKLLAYINRYVEHLHKHVIIICNIDRIKEDHDSENRFQKIQEKVVGKILTLEQNPRPIMEKLLNRENNVLLTYITSLSQGKKEFFYTFSRPQELTLNYRVWIICCREFEKAFQGLSIDYFKENRIIMDLLPNFFSLVYALHIYDFGNNHLFSKQIAKDLFVGNENSDEPFSKSKKEYKWFYRVFALKEETKSILPDSVWGAIIDNQPVDKNEIAQHWDLLLDKQQPLWLQLYNYLEKSDDEINTLWEELKEAYQSQLVQDSSQIVSIYSSVLDMIANKCCPDTDMTNDKAFELALTYIANYNSEPPHKVLKYTSRLFDNCETYGHHQRTSAFFKKFQRDFFPILLYFEQQYIIPENYNTLLKKLDLDEEAFDKYWYNGKMKYQSFFEYQPSHVLINKLLSLHPRKFKERLYTIKEYFFDSPTPNYTLLQFEKEMVSNFKKELLDKDKVIDHSKRYWIERVLPEFEEDIHKKEAELNKIHNQNILTDKELEQ